MFRTKKQDPQSRTIPAYRSTVAMIRTELYRAVSSCTDHTNTWYTKVPSCTERIGPLSDRVYRAVRYVETRRRANLTESERSDSDSDDGEQQQRLRRRAATVATAVKTSACNDRGKEKQQQQGGEKQRRQRQRQDMAT
ncbi:hypothetical protein BHE74_00015029 [Ensete ventricosum]|nr:hypothetical protein BHE74_00015029 [Ensete ventricosum]